jgi:hypothetical protein
MEPLILSPELLDALNRAAGSPVFLLDPATGCQAVVLKAEVYHALEEHFDIRETYPAQDAALAAVWDDPELDEYNEASR